MSEKGGKSLDKNQGFAFVYCLEFSWALEVKKGTHPSIEEAVTDMLERANLAFDY